MEDDIVTKNCSENSSGKYTCSMFTCRIPTRQNGQL